MDTGVSGVQQETTADSELLTDDNLGKVSNTSKVPNQSVQQSQPISFDICLGIANHYGIKKTI